jgi:hypothetical protein
MPLVEKRLNNGMSSPERDSFVSDMLLFVPFGATQLCFAPKSKKFSRLSVTSNLAIHA